MADHKHHIKHEVEQAREALEAARGVGNGAVTRAVAPSTDLVLRNLCDSVEHLIEAVAS